MSYTADAALERLHRFNRWFEPASPHFARKGLPSVRVTGYLRDESGWGAAARGYVRALQRAAVQTTLHDVSALTGNRDQDASVDLSHAGGEGDVNLVCVDAGQHFALMSGVGSSFFDGKYNIGAWAWELPRFPEAWYDRFAYYDEIWVGTSFIAAALAPIAPVPVVRVPPAVVPTGSRADGRRRLGVSDRDFVFAFVFDVHSHLLRKNPHAVIEAFRRAFPRPHGVRLVLKSVNAAADPDGYAELLDLAGDAPIQFQDGYWPSGEVSDLMAACDGYVSLHRSEGVGLTMAEAMALGKPVIATGWSGNTDFADVSNSFPVAFTLVPIARTVGPYRAGEIWAEPDVEHAAAHMREVVASPALARRRGDAARRRMQREYSVEAVATLVEARLRVIGSRERMDSLRTEVNAFVDRYQDLVREIHRIVEAVVPASDVVAIVSRGDSALLPPAPRRAWHFPEARPGVYAGYHPADSQTAIDALEEARGRGAGFFVLPGTAYWWVDHYDGLTRHLAERYRCVWHDVRCAIYDLRQPASGGPA